jgi:peptide/nickel transport system substrate-binding protein
MAKYGANQGEIRNGNFVATGTYGFQHPTGTGPLKFESWTIKQKLVLVRNNSYWGKKSNLDRVIFTPISDPTARLQALQTGEIQGYDLVNPPDVPTIQRSGSLKIVSRPAFNVGYVTINQKSAPFNNLLVRQAVAYGLDRAAVVRNFYAGRGTVAQEFMPPSIFGWTSKVPKYSYNPTKAKQLLQKAGLKLPVNVDFWYPTSVSRPYMPNPQANFEVFSASLEKSGFHVVPHSAPWRPDYVKKVDEGTAGDLNLIGWTGDYGDPDNFVGVFFGHRTDQFGFNNKAIFNILAKAQQTTNFATRVKLYQQANVMIMKFLPGVPYVHTKPALGFKKTVTGFIPSPVQEESFADINVGGQ